jgi:hypothetical protein
VTNQADLTPFNTVGTYTYKVQGVNAAGTGPKVSASVTVGPGAVAQLRSVTTTTASGGLNFPANTQPSDWLVLYVLSGVTDYSISGWATVPINVNQSNSGRRTKVFVRQAGATDTMVTLAPPVLYGAILAAYQGASSLGASVSGLAANTTTCAASLTRTSAGGVVVGGMGHLSGTFTVPASFTSQGTVGSLMSLADRNYMSTGTSSATWTQSGAQYSVCWFLELIP